jgi:acyl-CoA thioesterase YciA
VATVGIEAMSFHRPVYVGDRVSCYCSTLRVGRTSFAVQVQTWARRRGMGPEVVEVQVTEGVFTFVALNEDGSKRELPRDLRGA